MDSALDRLKHLTAKISSYELARKENMKTLKELFATLKIGEKVTEFDDIFEYKAINLSGLSLASETLGEVKEGRYVQIIAITYDKAASVKNKNSSLGYFGRAEKLDATQKTAVIGFVLRWRFEKSFRTLEHYHTMLESLKNPGDA